MLWLIPFHSFIPFRLFNTVGFGKVIKSLADCLNIAAIIRWFAIRMWSLPHCFNDILGWQSVFYFLLCCIFVKPLLINVTPLPPCGFASGPPPLSHGIIKLTVLLVYLSEHNQKLKKRLTCIVLPLLCPPKCSKIEPSLIYGTSSTISWFVGSWT